MIRNRLSEIMYEREIKVVRMAKDIGVARNTITNTASNTSEMLQMNTINKMCNYLKITPCEFFEYSPLDFEFKFFESEHLSLKVDNKIDPLGNDWFTFGFACILLIDVKENLSNIASFDTEIVSESRPIYNEKNNTVEIKVNVKFSTKEQEDSFISIYNQLSNEFKKMVYKDLVKQYKEFLKSILNNENHRNDEDYFMVIETVKKNIEIKFINEFFNYYSIH